MTCFIFVCQLDALWRYVLLLFYRYILYRVKFIGSIYMVNQTTMEGKKLVKKLPSEMNSTPVVLDCQSQWFPTDFRPCLTLILRKYLCLPVIFSSYRFKILLKQAPSKYYQAQPVGYVPYIRNYWSKYIWDYKEKCGKEPEIR